MYPAVLLLHSWLRWLVLVAAIVVLVRAVAGWQRARPWTQADNSAGKLFVIALDSQFLIGLILYAGLSPITRTALTDMGGAMRDGLLRFWGVEHAVGMIAALAIAHIGQARARRKPNPTARHRAVAISTGFALLVILLSIPWPGMAYGRPLLRW